MEKIKFGPSGIQENYFLKQNRKVSNALVWIKEANLNAFEYCFGKGYNMKISTAEQLGKIAVNNNITISVHAPYFINLGNPSEESEEKAFNMISKGLDFLDAFKGEHLVIHIGSQGKEERSVVLERIKTRILNIVNRLKLKDNFNKKTFICLETMGKFSQIGNYKEIIDFCSLDEMLIPTFDFGHINCLLQGKLNEEEIENIFKYSFEKLGEFKTKNSHIHFSKIKFSNKGELAHLNYDSTEFGPDFKDLNKVIKKLNLTPTIISESTTNMFDDILTIKKIYEEN